MLHYTEIFFLYNEIFFLYNEMDVHYNERDVIIMILIFHYTK